MQNMGRHVRGWGGILAVASVVAAVAGCGGTSSASPSGAPSTTPSVAPPNVPDPVGATGKVLGNAKVTALPGDQLYVSYLKVTQPAASTIANGSESGFVFVLSGVHRITAGGQSSDVNAGEGAFVDGAAAATHGNPSGGDSTWYFVSIRPVSARSGATPIQGARAAYGTPGLPAFGPGTYAETLRLTTIAPGGRTQAHLHGGIEVIHVLQGAVRVRIAGAAPANLKAGQGIRILPGTPQQQFNDGTQNAVLLVFLITLDGVPFQTNLNTSP